jgi:MFS transporter, NHS family, xanthosine permease
MGIKGRLILMNFFQYFVWGAWLISLGGYMYNTLGFSGFQIGSIYGTMGIASLFMPGVIGIVADRWINAERLYGLLHILGGLLLFWASQEENYDVMYWILLLNAMVYMPTIALSNSVAFTLLERNKYQVVKDFPPIRVWGTIGFICAMWIVDLMAWDDNASQFYLGSASAVALGIYSFTLPGCPPAKVPSKGSLVSALGLDAFVLFRRRIMAVFFLFSAFLGMALQITNAFGKTYLNSFGAVEAYKDTFAVSHPGLLMSISQMSETLFILTIPFFLRRFGIKIVMLLSIVAWVFRFGFFAFGDPGSGLWMLVMSMVIYGMAFDFFNISGNLFVEAEAESHIRSSAQGLFMIMTNGLGALVGGLLSGLVVDYFTTQDAAGNPISDWQSIWLTFAGYALVLAIVFPFVFRYRHDPKAVQNVVH